MLSRIVTWLFVACLIFTPIGLLGSLTTDSGLWYGITITAICFLVFCAGYAMFGAYKELTKPDETQPTKSWQRGSLLVSLSLAGLGLICCIIGMFGSSIIPFLISGAAILTGLGIALAGANGVFRKIDQKRNEKLNPKPKPEPKVIEKITPPHERPGYQYSFDF